VERRKTTTEDALAPERVAASVFADALGGVERRERRERRARARDARREEACG
jgi:hypothetical protein|tara:strand:- start:1890 stop:2045 length:156 start_codon:yes stop_codon:yes gene_type:complete